MNKLFVVLTIWCSNLGNVDCSILFVYSLLFIIHSIQWQAKNFFVFFFQVYRVLVDIIKELCKFVSWCSNNSEFVVGVHLWYYSIAAWLNIKTSMLLLYFESFLAFAVQNSFSQSLKDLRNEGCAPNAKDLRFWFMRPISQKYGDELERYSWILTIIFSFQFNLISCNRSHQNLNNCSVFFDLWEHATIWADEACFTCIALITKNKWIKPRLWTNQLLLLSFNLQIQFKWVFSFNQLYNLKWFPSLAN